MKLISVQMKRIPIVSAMLLALFGQLWVSGAAAQGLTDEDFVYLPKYCKSRMNRGADWDYWQGVFGSTWIHIHHYCIGLRVWQKSWGASNEIDRRFLLERAEANFNYVLQRTTPGFVLYPQIAFNMGQVQEGLGRGGQAVKYYMSAIKQKPDYAPAYGALSDYYKRLGNLDEAKKVLEEGLSRNPSSKGLKRRAVELGL